MDLNGDGLLSVHEIAVATGYTDEEIDEWARHQCADADGNGGISADELWMLDPSYECEEGAHMDFEAMDKDGNGRLTMTEVAEATGASLEDVIYFVHRQRADLDCDGTISEEEMPRLADPEYEAPEGTPDCTPPGKGGFSAGLFVFGLLLPPTLAGFTLLPAHAALLERTPAASTALKCAALAWLFVIGLLVGVGGGAASFGWGFVLGTVLCVAGCVAHRAQQAKQSGASLSLHALVGDFLPAPRRAPTAPLAAADTAPQSTFVPPVLAQPPPAQGVEAPPPPLHGAEAPLPPLPPA